MTRFTVVWTDQALRHLTNIWMGAANPAAVTAAAHTIDQELARDAPTKGVVWKGAFRMLACPPLSAMFTVVEPDRQVHVITVRLDDQSLSDPQGNGQAAPPESQA